MTTKTEPRPRRTADGERVPDLWRYLLALLATAYLVAWWSFMVRLPAPDATAQDTPPAEPAGSPRLPPMGARWYDDLPPAQRPVVQLPPGWKLAARATERVVPGTPTAPAAPARVATYVPRPVRVAPARVGRIRTRSS